MSTFFYYKSLNTLTNQGTHNSPPLWHFRVVRSFNLTFEGYLAGTTPMLSVRSSLFALNVLFRAREAVWITVDFSASLVGAICGNTLWFVSHIIASRTKSYMVLTRSIATTNNVQGDKPWPTALERQVQTLTVAMEHLTKQNHDLEEQLQ